MSLDPTIVKRLALIKFMARNAENQSKKGEPLSLLALLTYHDLVEWFLNVCCDHLSIPVTKQTGFEDYLKLIDQRLQPTAGLQLVNPIRKLNTERVQLKHYATLPHPDFVDEIRISVPQFLSLNSQVILGISLDSISMADLIEFELARKALKSSEDSLAAGNLRGGLESAALAYDELIREYQSKHAEQTRGNQFSLGGDPTWLRDLGSTVSTLSGRGGMVDMTAATHVAREFGKQLYQVVSDLQAVTRVLSMGIDYKKYSRFKNMVPLVLRTASGVVSFHIPSFRRQTEDAEDLGFCIEFVLESALTLQESI